MRVVLALALAFGVGGANAVEGGIGAKFSLGESCDHGDKAQQGATVIDTENVFEEDFLPFGFDLGLLAVDEAKTKHIFEAAKKLGSLEESAHDPGNAECSRSDFAPVTADIEGVAKESDHFAFAMNREVVDAAEDITGQKPYFVYKQDDGSRRTVLQVGAGDTLQFKGPVDVAASTLGTLQWFTGSIEVLKKADEFAWLPPFRHGAGPHGAFVCRLGKSFQKFDMTVEERLSASSRKASAETDLATASQSLVDTTETMTADTNLFDDAKADNERESSCSWCKILSSHAFKIYTYSAKETKDGACEKVAKAQGYDKSTKNNCVPTRISKCPVISVIHTSGSLDDNNKLPVSGVYVIQDKKHLTHVDPCSHPGDLPKKPKLQQDMENPDGN